MPHSKFSITLAIQNKLYLGLRVIKVQLSIYLAIWFFKIVKKGVWEMITLVDQFIWLGPSVIVKCSIFPGDIVIGDTTSFRGRGLWASQYCPCFVNSWYYGLHMLVAHNNNSWQYWKFYLFLFHKIILCCSSCQ